MEDRIEIVISPSILAELERVLEYPKIQKAVLIEEQRISGLIHRLKKYAVFTNDAVSVDVVAADPSDNKFIACAVEGNADFIVTGDKHLLDIGSYQGIRILTPRMFLEEVKSNA